MYYVCFNVDYEELDCFSSLEDAIEMIRKYERDDDFDGIFKEGCYVIIHEDELIDIEFMDF